MAVTLLKGIKMKFFKKRILPFILILVLVTFTVFGLFNKPKAVRADILSIAALGGGALATIVAAYFATSGIVLEGSGGSGGSEFLGNYVANYVVNSPSFVNNQYFDSSGNWIGSAEQLSMVQNTENGVVSFIFGKDFAAWLNVLTNAFVQDNSLELGTSTVLESGDTISFISGDFPVQNAGTSYHNTSYYGLVGDRSNALFSYPDTQVGTYNFQITENYYMRIVFTAGGDRYYYTVYSSTDGVNYNALNNNDPLRLDYYLGFVINDYGQFALARYQSNSVRVNYPSPYYSLADADVSTMSLEGSLTDGYEDFQDAIGQDMEKEKDNAEAVFGINVGAYNPALSPDLIAEALLDSILAGDYTGEYEGSYENQEEAEEELQEEQEFVPEVPPDWVIVNGLEDFFPFCIPFDLYNLISMFNVPAQAPVFEWKMNFADRFDDYTITIDLSPYETVAVVFRIMLVIGFVIFLILKTRDLIRG